MNLPIVLVRFNEIALKSKNTRSALRRLLRHNILTTLRMNNASLDSIEDTWERLIIHTDESEEVADIAAKVFGVASASPAIECASNIEVFPKVVSDMARQKLKAGDSFAVRVRRVGKHEFTMNEIAAKCGSSVIQALENDGKKIRVDLDSPDHEFFVEVRGERTFVYNRVIRGVGGLPLGSQGKVVSHLENFESVLATWLMMKRGCTPILVLFTSGEDWGELIDVTRSTLLPYAGEKLPIIELPLMEIIGKTVPSGLLGECLRYLAMANIAQLQGAEGVISSERLEHLDTTHLKTVRECTGILNLPVFYPLVGLDDEHVGSLAERIGGKSFANKIRTEKFSGRESQEGKKSSVPCNLDSVIQNYQEKIREAIASFLSRMEV